MHPEERVLNLRINRVVQEVDMVLKDELNVRWFDPSPTDKLRLLTLALWRERYRVSIPWIVRLLVPFWKGRYAKYNTARGIGTTIATLCGKKSEEIIKERLAIEFPENDNLHRYTAQEQQRQWAYVWDRNPPVQDWTEARATVRKYLTRLRTERRERRKFQKSQQKRNYRGNPWIE
jgi:hypothetical protein